MDTVIGQKGNEVRRPTDREHLTPDFDAILLFLGIHAFGMFKGIQRETVESEFVDHLRGNMFVEAHDQDNDMILDQGFCELAGKTLPTDFPFSLMKRRK